MSTKSVDFIKSWIKEFKVDSVEKNDLEFIEHFTNWITETTENDNWEFEGENDYCGYTAQAHEIPARFNWNFYDAEREDVSVEFAYGFHKGVGFVKVFTYHHNGFWVPEYIDLVGEEADTILNILKERTLSWNGF